MPIDLYFTAIFPTWFSKEHFILDNTRHSVEKLKEIRNACFNNHVFDLTKFPKLHVTQSGKCCMKDISLPKNPDSIPAWMLKVFRMDYEDWTNISNGRNIQVAIDTMASHF